MRRNGKTLLGNLVMGAALEGGHHVHAGSLERGWECLGGRQDCPLWVEQMERLNPGSVPTRKDAND